MERHIPKVGLDKIVTLRFRDSSEQLQVCIRDQKPGIVSGINFITPRAPLARAILNRMEGETINFISPGGMMSVEIVQVGNKEIAG